jgi:formate/nitrite transporter FocA (FNT family)
MNVEAHAKPEDEEELVAKRQPREILRQELSEGLESMEATNLTLLISGISAGLDIGFSPLLLAVMHSQTHDLSRPVIEILDANTYAIGFVFVVLGRSELFTEQTTLAVLPVLNKNAPVSALVRMWALVYVANLLGGAAFAALASVFGPGSGILDPQVLGVIARRSSEHPSGVILLSAVLAGWLMGLLSWLVAAGRDTMSQIAIVWLVSTVIGFLHLHHVIEGSIQLMMAQFMGQGIGADFFRVLELATLGNILGGSCFVALIKYGHVAWGASDNSGSRANRLTPGT